VNPRKPRAKKKAAPKKKASAKKSEDGDEDENEASAAEEEIEEEEEVEDSDDGAEEDVDDEGHVAVFEVGDKVQNSARLRWTIEECNGNGTYTVRYNDGRADLKLPARLITALPTGMLLLIF
jgi:hypothetical protein